LIIQFPIVFKHLSDAGKKYPWPNLNKCPTCKGSRLWGHGYVLRYFDEHPEGLWLKRYRCPDCGAVHTIRPEGYYRSFLAPWIIILASLIAKALSEKWLSCVSRQRQQYWWKGFLKQASRHSNIEGELYRVLGELFLSSIILSTHSLKYFEIKPFRITPYLIFAVTPPYGFG
jgi:hypothetical protein